MLSHVIMIFLLLTIPSDRQVGETTRGLPNSNSNHYFYVLLSFFTTHSLMHINIPQKAANAYF